MKTRNGKIGRLPKKLREVVNRRIENGDLMRKVSLLKPAKLKKSAKRKK
jgi:hypothetical protein